MNDAATAASLSQCIIHRFIIHDKNTPTGSSSAGFWALNEFILQFCFYLFLNIVLLFWLKRLLGVFHRPGNNTTPDRPAAAPPIFECVHSSYHIYHKLISSRVDFFSSLYFLFSFTLLFNLFILKVKISSSIFLSSTRESPPFLSY